MKKTSKDMVILFTRLMHYVNKGIVRNCSFQNGIIEGEIVVDCSSHKGGTSTELHFWTRTQSCEISVEMKAINSSFKNGSSRSITPTVNLFADLAKMLIAFCPLIRSHSSPICKQIVKMEQGVEWLDVSQFGREFWLTNSIISQSCFLKPTSTHEKESLIFPFSIKKIRSATDGRDEVSVSTITNESDSPLYLELCGRYAQRLVNQFIGREVSIFEAAVFIRNILLAIQHFGDNRIDFETAGTGLYDLIKLVDSQYTTPPLELFEKQCANQWF